MIMKNEPITLNSRGEYNRCQLPRLTVMMCDKEQEDKEEIGMEEERNEYLLQEDHKRNIHPNKTIRTRKMRKLSQNQPAIPMPGQTYGKMAHKEVQREENFSAA